MEQRVFASQQPVKVAKQVLLNGDRVVNSVLRKTVQYHVEELHQAAAQRDVLALHRTAQRLKQMTLCHSPSFDVLAISAYRLQMAAATGSHKAALCYVQQVVDSGHYTLQQLLRKDIGHESSVTRAKLTRSFFSHAIQLQHEVVEAAEEDGDTLSTPVYEKKALATFRGDTVVLGGTRSLFVQLLPSWLDVVTEAMDDFDLLVIQAESYFLSSLASLIGAIRLARLLMGFRLACDDHAMELHALRR